MPVSAQQLERDNLEKQLQDAEISRLRGLGRILDDTRTAAIKEHIKKIMLGKDVWLKQMQDAHTRAGTLSPDRIIQLHQEAKRLAEVEAVRERPFLANLKHESDNLPVVALAPKKTPGLEGIFSNLNLGDGAGPFAPFLKFFQQIMGFLFGFISQAKKMNEDSTPEKTPMESVKSLVEEGSLAEANAKLTTQENELIDKLTSVEERQDLAPGVFIVSDFIARYKAELVRHKNIQLPMGNGIASAVQKPFTETTPIYQENILRSRMKMLNEITSKVSPILAANEEVLRLRAELSWKEEKVRKLKAEVRVVPIEEPEKCQLLIQRRLALKREKTLLNQKCDLSQVSILRKFQKVLPSIQGIVDLVTRENDPVTRQEIAQVRKEVELAQAQARGQGQGQGLIPQYRHAAGRAAARRAAAGSRPGPAAEQRVRRALYR